MANFAFNKVILWYNITLWSPLVQCYFVRCSSIQNVPFQKILFILCVYGTFRHYSVRGYFVFQKILFILLYYVCSAFGHYICILYVLFGIPENAVHTVCKACLDIMLFGMSRWRTTVVDQHVRCTVHLSLELPLVFL